MENEGVRREMRKLNGKWGSKMGNDELKGKCERLEWNRIGLEGKLCGLYEKWWELKGKCRRFEWKLGGLEGKWRE